MKQAVVSPRQPRSLTTTERNWLIALAIAVLGTVLAALVANFEQGQGITNSRERLVGNPVEAWMRFLALPHFLLAILFQVTSLRMRTVRAMSWLVGLAALGIVLCWLFNEAGGRTARLPNALFLVYFLVHAFRDETYFYGRYGDVPPSPDPARQRRHLWAVPALSLAAVAAVFVFGAAFRIGGTRRYADMLYGSLGPEIRGAIGIAAVLAVVAAFAWTRRTWDRHQEGGARAFVRLNRPIFVVFGGLLAVLVLDIVINGRVYAIVTMHVAAWYVFVNHGYRNQPAPDPAPRRFTWLWMRCPGTGFNVLHTVVL
ncbi:MAG: hypothetical protein GY946_16215, partial [bacterium]|nr:hypothetical protein [bacterium]